MTKTIGVISVAGVVAAVGLIWAQDGPPGFGGGFGGREGFRLPMSPVVTALDSNEDGAISAKEINNAPKSLLKLDKNKDGQLTEEELRPNFGGRGFGRGEGRGEGREGRGEGRGEGQGPAGASPTELVQTLMAFDKNKDGKLQKAEVPERMQGMFTRGDANHDDVLTEGEIKAMASAQAAPQGGGGGRGEGREGRGEGRGFGRGPGRMDPIVGALDADHDGTISAAEIKNSPAALRTLDKNGDGQLADEEIRPAFGRGRGGFGPRPE